MAIATILPLPRAVFYDQRGNPLSAGLVYTYVPNSFPTPKQTWQDAAETLPNTNPIVLDADGSCLLYGSGSYTLIVTDALGNQIPAFSGLTTDTLSGAIAAFSPVIPNIAALRLATITTLSQSSAYVLGYYSGHDGGEGMFVVGTTAADNGGTIIVDASARTWYRETGGGPYSVKWFGAKGDQSNDDSVPIQATINYCINTGTGPVFFPAGYYVCLSQININTNGLRCFGASDNNTLLSAGAADQNLLVITGQRNALDNMFLNNPFFAVGSAVLNLSAAVETKIDSCLITGGYYPILINNGSADTIISRTKVYNSYGTAQITTANGSGNYFDRVKIDQAWPAGVPVAANLLGVWTPNTPVTGLCLMQIGNYYLQCIGGGTTGNLTPVLPVYGTQIVDGTVAWQLAMNIDMTGVNIDSDSFYTVIDECDITGAYKGGVWITNSLNTVAPQKIFVKTTEISTFLEFGVGGFAGSGLTVDQSTINTGIEAGASGVFLGTAWADAATITGNLIYGMSTGVEVGFGPNANVSFNQVFGCTVAGIHVAMDITDFTINGNTVGASVTWGQNAIGIEVAAGASDDYIITSNNTTGALAGIIDGGTGINKAVANNI